MTCTRRCKNCQRVGCAAMLFECSDPGPTEAVDLDYHMFDITHLVDVPIEPPSLVQFIINTKGPWRDRK